MCTNEAVTGSRIVEKRCYARSEAAKRRAADQEAADRLLIKSNTAVKHP